MTMENEDIEEGAVYKNLERYLQFQLGEEKYAIPLLEMKEVIPVPDTRKVPNADNYYVGVMNLRGQIISIIDLRTKLKIKPKEKTGTLEDELIDEATIIVSIDGIDLGLVVDSIDRVISVDVDTITEVPEIKSHLNAKNIQGVHQGEDNLCILLDLESILDISKIKALSSKVA